MIVSLIFIVKVLMDRQGEAGIDLEVEATAMA
jgi:hypothetical protein